MVSMPAPSIIFFGRPLARPSDEIKSLIFFLSLGNSIIDPFTIEKSVKEELYSL